MGKLGTYLVMMSGIMLVFYFAGLLPPETAGGVLLTLLLNPENILNSSLASQIALAITGAASVGAVLIGYFTRDSRLIIAGPFASYMLNLGYGFVAVFSSLYDQNGVLAILLLAPLLVLYGLVIVEWLLGQDS